MTYWFQKSAKLKRAITSALLVSFAFLSLFAPGMMPAYSAASQSMEVVICTSNGLRTILIHTGDAPTEEPERDLCAWAGYGQSEILPITDITIRRFDAHPIQVSSLKSTIWVGQKKTSNQHNRAPPFSI